MAVVTVSSPALRPLLGDSSVEQRGIIACQLYQENDMRRFMHLTVLLGLSVALTACASRRTATTTTADEPTTLVVRNES